MNSNVKKFEKFEKLFSLFQGDFLLTSKPYGFVLIQHQPSGWEKKIDVDASTQSILQDLVDPLWEFIIPEKMVAFFDDENLWETLKEEILINPFLGQDQDKILATHLIVGEESSSGYYKIPAGTRVFYSSFVLVEIPPGDSWEIEEPVINWDEIE